MKDKYNQYMDGNSGSSPSSISSSSPEFSDTSNSNTFGAHVLNEIGIGLYKTTAAGIILFTNSNLVSMLNYNSAAELYSENLNNAYYHPSYSRAYFMKRMETEGSVTGLEAIWRRRDGEAFWARESAIAIRDENNNIVYFEGIVEDITDQMNLSVNAINSRLRLNTIEHGSPVPIFFFNMNNQFIDANEEGLKLLGYSREELTQLSLTNVFTMPNRIKSKQRKILAEKNIDCFEIELLTKDKKQITAINNSLPLYDKAGMIIGVQSIIVDVSEVKKKDECVHFLGLLSTHINYAIISTDLDFKITYTNKAFEDIYGYTFEEVKGKVPDFLDAGLNSEEFKANIYETVAQGKMWTGENLNRKKDGSLFYNELMVFPVYNQFSQIIGYSSTQLDITERKNAEAAIRLQGNLAMALNGANSIEEAATIGLNAALKVSNLDSGGVYIVDQETNDLNLVHSKGLSHRFVEAITCVKAGSPEALLTMKGDPVCIKYGNDKYPLSKVGLTEGLRLILVIPISVKGKVVACLNLSSTTFDTLSDSDSDVFGLFASQLGLTIARLRSECELRESEECLRSFMEQSPLPIQFFDVNGNPLQVNQAWERLWGITLEDAQRAQFNLFTDPQIESTIYKPLIEIALMGEAVSIPPIKYDASVLAQTGNEKWVKVSMFPLKDGVGEIQNLVTFQEDVTDQMKAEQALEQSRKQEEIQRAQLLHNDRLRAVGQLAAGVAHEINNPLSVLYGTLQSVRMGSSLDFSKDPEAVERSLRVTKRISEIVNNLLSFSRQTPSAKALFDVNSLIKEVLSLVISQIEKKGIDLNLNLVPLPKIQINKEQIQQVILNLVLNAKDSISEQGKIGIRTYQTYKYTVIEVIDDGYGIPEEHTHDIFTPFFTTKEIGKGTGLGLSISHGIIKEHNGNIEVSSRIGVGTSMKVYLPNDGDPA